MLPSDDFHPELIPRYKRLSRNRLVLGMHTTDGLDLDPRAGLPMPGRVRCLADTPMVEDKSFVFVGTGLELVVVKVCQNQMDVAWSKRIGQVADMDLRETLLLVGLADGAVTCADIDRPQRLADKTRLSSVVFQLRGSQHPTASAVVGWHPSMHPLACSAVGQAVRMLDLRSR
jgi:hypothetical protein